MVKLKGETRESSPAGLVAPSGLQSARLCKDGDVRRAERQKKILYREDKASGVVFVNNVGMLI